MNVNMFIPLETLNQLLQCLDKLNPEEASADLEFWEKLKKHHNLRGIAPGQNYRPEGRLVGNLFEHFSLIPLQTA